MKPYMRRHPRFRDLWMCGFPPYGWCIGWTPEQAYRLWKFSQERAKRWVDGRYVG